jgi:hypothetical protein
MKTKTEQSMSNRIIEWLQKTGYPLELFGESILNELDFKIINSYIYLDFEKQINRELDLFGSFHSEKNDINLSLNLLVECKKSDKPIILLTSNNSKENYIELSEYIYLDNPNFRAIIKDCPKIILPGRCSFGFKIIQAFTDGDEFTNKAANTLIKSLHEFNSESMEFLEISIKDNHHSLILPVLLIDAPLFELVINENKEIELKEIDSCILEYRNLLPALEREFLIPIIHKNHFKEFVKNYKKSSEPVLDFLTANPLYQIRKYHTTKISLEKIE